MVAPARNGGGRTEAAGRVAVLLHPHGAAAAPQAWARTFDALQAAVGSVTLVATHGDGSDRERIAALLRDEPIDALAAAGGDGTVNAALAAILASPRPPALAFLPLGTGDMIARSLGLASLRGGGERAVTLAVGAIAAGQRRRIDVGVANGHPFAASFAFGIDAEILALRNRLRRRLGFAGEAGGYVLYLTSCALRVMAQRGEMVRVMYDGAGSERRHYNLNVMNAPLYAGEFRFDGANDLADGLLDVHAVAGALEYLAEYPRAWRRHVHFERGDPVEPSPLLRRVREVAVDLSRPVPAQIDGEEFPPAASFRINVLPRAVTVCVPFAVAGR